MSFQQWIERYCEKDTKSGKLARLVVSDSGFPQIRSKVLIEVHIYNLCEDAELIKCFRREWKKYLEFLREMEY